MIPTAYEFHWDLGHVFFLGIFYSVVAVVLATLGIALYKSLTDLHRRRARAVAWQETFHDLPDHRRHCRHEFRGTVAERVCEHGFDCSTCQEHFTFQRAERQNPPTVSAVGRIELPDARYYHRGHTWVEPQPDGTLQIGLDDLACRCFGDPDRVVLPAAGSELGPGDPIATIFRGPYQVRVLAPACGEVVEVGDLLEGRLCVMQPDEDRPFLENLLHGDEAGVWMMREMESLEGQLHPTASGPALADGGMPVDDLFAACPDADWDSIWGQVCLDS